LLVKNRLLGNVIQLTGYVFIDNGDFAGTSHIVYEKSAVEYQNQQAVLTNPKHFKLPSRASNLKCMRKTYLGVES